jgi:hypothetical protein
MPVSVQSHTVIHMREDDEAFCVSSFLGNIRVQHPPVSLPGRIRLAPRPTFGLRRLVNGAAVSVGVPVDVLPPW